MIDLPISILSEPHHQFLVAIGIFILTAANVGAQNLIVFRERKKQ